MYPCRARARVGDLPTPCPYHNVTTQRNGEACASATSEYNTRPVKRVRGEVLDLRELFLFSGPAISKNI